MRKRIRVWLVDDREQNRKQFVERHGKEFDIKTFETPDQLLSALRSQDSPDALLCDIFYYTDPVKREEIESQIEKEAKRLQKLADDLHAMDAAEGIPLIQRIQEEFTDKFPIYAYTSKGPYLLHNENFDQLEQLNARWLFKNKYSAQAERHRIIRDVEEFREHNEFWPHMWRVALQTGLVGALAGAILGVIFDRIAKFFCW